MKTKLLIISLSTFILSCSSIKMKENIPYKRFDGGRYGYSHNQLNIYLDSTFYFAEWTHTGALIKDMGNVEYINGKIYLNSTKSISRYRKEVKSKKLHFIKKEILIHNDTLTIIPDDKKDIQFNKEYNTLISKNQCNHKTIYGGNFNFVDYLFKCPIYNFSEKSDSISEWKNLEPNYMGKLGNELYFLKEKIERIIEKHSGEDFSKDLEFSSVSVNYPDSIKKFKGVAGIIKKKCKAKYFFYYYYTPIKNAKYEIGIPMNENGEIMIELDLPSKENFKPVSKLLDICEVIRLAKVYNKNIEPIEKIKFEYDKKNEMFYWIITQKGKRIKRINGYFNKSNIVKIDASNGKLIMKGKIKRRVFPNTRYY